MSVQVVSVLCAEETHLGICADSIGPLSHTMTVPRTGGEVCVHLGCLARSLSMWRASCITAHLVLFPFLFHLPLVAVVCASNLSCACYNQSVSLQQRPLQI